MGLDIMGVQGFDLLDLANGRNFKVAMLTAHVLTAENLNRSFKMKAMAYLSEEKRARLFPFWEMF